MTVECRFDSKNRFKRALIIISKLISMYGHSRECGNPEWKWKMEKQFFVYILASKRNGTLYIGVTSDLLKRIWQHKNKLFDGFSKKYEVDKLVYYEIFPDSLSAIKREKRIKKWRRVWKLRIIEEKNPEWKDLFQEIGGSDLVCQHHVTPAQAGVQFN